MENVEGITVFPLRNAVSIELALDFGRFQRILCYVHNGEWVVKAPVNFSRNMETAEVGAMVLAGSQDKGKKGTEVPCFNLSELAIGYIKSELMKKVKINDVATLAEEEVAVDDSDFEEVEVEDIEEIEEIS